MAWECFWTSRLLYLLHLLPAVISPLRPYVARLACYLNHCNFSPWLQPQTVQINRSWIPVIYVNFYHFFLVAESKTANENNFRVSVRIIFVTAEANNPMQTVNTNNGSLHFFFLHQTFDVHHKTNSLQFDWQLISSWGSRAAAALGQPAVPTSPAPWIWKAKHLYCRHFCLFFFFLLLRSHRGCLAP